MAPEAIESGIRAEQSAAKLVSLSALVPAGRGTQSRLLFDAATGWSVVVTRFSSEATRDINVQIAFHRWSITFKLPEAFKSQVD